MNSMENHVASAGEPPAIQIPSVLFAEMEEHSRANADREVCGFVYHDRYVRLTNIAKDPNSFRVDPSEIAQCLARYGEPSAIFHSHPNGSLHPSHQDLKLRSYYINSTIIIGKIINGRLELTQI